MLTYNLNSDVSISWGNDFIKVSGPKGIIVKHKTNFTLAIKENILYLWSVKDPELEAGYLSWLHQLIVGVTKGYKQKLKLIGVGYRASLNDQILVLKLGFSHEIRYTIPNDVKIIPSKNKGILLLLQGVELERVQQVAVEIRRFRMPDAYKGKGVHYYGETLRLKKGKREGK